MRLRPSGRQGPVATSVDSFQTYQRLEAWTWEHLALTRARVVAGAPDLGAEVEAARLAILAEKAGGEKVAQDVAEMRLRLRAAKPGLGALEAKDGAGRLMDIELLAQMLALRAASGVRRVEGQITAGKRAGLLAAQDEAALLASYRLLWRVQACLRQLGDRVTDPAALGDGARRFLLRETGAESVEALVDRLGEASAVADGVIARVLG